MDSISSYVAQAHLERTLILDPDHTREVRDGQGLDRFGRKLVRVGSINAVVPAQIAAFDDGFSQEPNFYDGLPGRAKLLYLLTTLSSGQRDIMAKRGLSLGDCRGDQTAILKSILPKQLSWTHSKVAESGKEEVLSTTTMSGKDLEGVRIQIVRSLQIQATTDNNPGGVVPLIASWDPGPGGTVKDRHVESQRGNIKPLGVQFRANVDNKLKVGALDTRRLDLNIELPKTTTVSEALAMCGQTFNGNVVADLRIRSKRLSWTGGNARVGDVLDSIALTVGGTYRRVGSTYLLTSDLIGAGARQVKFVAWLEANQGLVHRKELEWKMLLSQSGAMLSFGYASNDKLAATPQMDQALDANQAPLGMTFRTSQLPSQIQGFLHRAADRNPNQHINLDQVAVSRTNVFRFVLPDGTPLEAEPEDLGMDRTISLARVSSSGSGAGKNSQQLMDRLIDDARARSDAQPLPIVVKAENQAEASMAVELAKRFGLREVWLDTPSKSALKVATQSGLIVKLFISPWEQRSAVSPGTLDRTILGDDSNSFGKRITNDPAFLSRYGEPYTLPHTPRNLIQPGASNLNRHLQALIELSKVPNLAGVVVSMPIPYGYEGKRTGWQTLDWPPALAAAASFGYTIERREQFIAQHGVDPIDLGWGALRTDVDLQPNFFPDVNLLDSGSEGESGPVPETFDNLLQQWDLERGRLNLGVIKSLLTQMSGIPIEVECRSPVMNLLASPYPETQVYYPRLPLPTVPGPNASRETKTSRVLAVVGPNGAPDNVKWAITESLIPNSRRQPTALDLRALPPSQWELALSRYEPVRRSAAQREGN